MLRISIIIPLLEPSEYFPKALASVFSGTLASSSRIRIECIVAITDRAIISEHESAIHNLGARVLECDAHSTVEAINAGFAAAGGDIVGKLTPNNILLEGWANHLCDSVDAAASAKFFYFHALEIDDNDKAFKSHWPRVPTLRNLRSRLCLVEECIFYRPEVFRQIGYLDASLTHRSEYDFLIRLAQNDARGSEVKQKLFGLRAKKFDDLTLVQQYESRIEAIDESICILESNGLEPANRWYLARGTLEAEQAGIDRRTTIGFDRRVLSAALDSKYETKRSDSKSDFAKVVSLAVTHARIEANILLKHPRLATRFIPNALKSMLVRSKNVRRAASRRIFQLRFDMPYPCALPATYFTKPKQASQLKISIATPNLNQGQFIERTIKSVLSQSYPNLEYVVQDGCSRDESVAVIDKYSSYLAAWQSVKDHGQSHAINMGLARTTGDIMAYLNSDDLLLPGSLATVAKYFEEHPDVDVVYGDRILIDEEDRMINHWILPEHDNDLIAYADFIPQETMFWRRRAWEAIGSHVDESFHFAMDWDMILRFRSNGLKFAHIPQFLGAFRITDGQKTNQLHETVGLKDMNRLRLRELGYAPSDMEIASKVKPYLRKQKIAEQKFDVVTAWKKTLRQTKLWSPNTWQPENQSNISGQVARAA